jgi:putative inorganic carbon (hco3(-)) transporter
MAKDHPLGVGPDNFQNVIGSYRPIRAGRDAHNTYIRCICELGWVGFLVMMAMLVNGVVCMWKVIRRAKNLRGELRDHVVYPAYALLVGLVVLAACGFWGSLVYTELFWWMLALPVCMMRVAANTEEDLAERRVERRKVDDGKFKGYRTRRAKDKAWSSVR